jgi:hypothetical protein
MSSKSFAVISITAAILCAVALSIDPPATASAGAAAPAAPVPAAHAVVPQPDTTKALAAAWEERKATPRLAADGQ